MPRANKAVSREKPEGSQVSSPNRSVLQQHVDFWDRCAIAAAYQAPPILAGMQHPSHKSPQTPHPVTNANHVADVSPTAVHTRACRRLHPPLYALPPNHPVLIQCPSTSSSALL